MNPAKLYFKLKHANADLWIKALQNRTFNKDFVMCPQQTAVLGRAHTHSQPLVTEHILVKSNPSAREATDISLIDTGYGIIGLGILWSGYQRATQYAKEWHLQPLALFLGENARGCQHEPSTASWDRMRTIW